MYQVELHGKLSLSNEHSEDILTSNVFSFLKYADRAVFLYSYLQSLGISISRGDAHGAEFRFWPHFSDGTEPDLVIVVGDHYVLFEAKYFSGFGLGTETAGHQLIREIEGGRFEARSLGKQFHMIAITAHYSTCVDEFAHVPENMRSTIHWTNWQQVALTVESILDSETPMSLETRSFAEDLHRLLQRKDLRSYAGTKLLEKLRKLTAHAGIVFFDASTADYRGSFIGFLGILKLTEPVGATPDSIFFGEHTTLFGDLFTFSGEIGELDDHIFFGGHT
jgi:hypothetical protein